MSTNSTDEPFVQDWSKTTGGGYSFIRLPSPSSKSEKAPELAATAARGRPLFARFKPSMRGTWRKDRQNILFWSYRAGSRARARTRKGPHN